MAGFFAGSIFVVRLGDIFGRKWVLVAVSFLSSVSLLLMALISNLTVVLVSVFVFGITATSRWSIAYVYAIELTTKEHQPLYAMMSMMFDSSAFVLIGTYFYFVKDMTPILYTLAAIQMVCIVVQVVFIPESPFFLYEKNKLPQFF